MSIKDLGKSLIDGTSNVFTTGINQAIGLIGGIIDDVVTTKEEKDTIKMKTEIGLKQLFNELAVEEEETKRKEIDARVSEMKSARDMQIKIAQTKNASFLQKNILPILALIWTITSIILFVAILFGKITIQDSLVILIVNIVGNAISLILGFFFGSSNQQETNKLN